MIKDTIEKIIITISISVFICVFTWLCICEYQCLCGSCEYMEKTKLIENTTIYSLSTNNEYGLKGSFILGSGSIHGNGNTFYYFYKKDGNGKRLVKSPAYCTVIIETNDIKPHMEYYEIDGTYVLKNGMICDNAPTRPEIILYVPLNTTPTIFTGEV